MKVGQSDVAGAAGGPDKGKVAGESGGPAKDATQAGGAVDAAKGADALGGGGGDLASALDALKKAVASLAEAVQKMGAGGATDGGGGKDAGGKDAGGCGMGGCGGGAKVAGVQGEAASKEQYVAKTVSVANNEGEDDAFEKRVLELINVERQKAGLAPVSYQGALDNAAEKHAQHMSIVGKMAHEGIGDGDPGERIRAEGWRRSWGENVATGQTSPEQVVREWMNSPDHRRNILDPNFRSMGVGYVTGSNGRSYWAQEFGA
jgi:uncharacterized protein YkwD